jgi:hypothetical protein
VLRKGYTLIWLCCADSRFRHVFMPKSTLLRRDKALRKVCS